MKQSEIKKFSIEELKEKLLDNKKKLSELRMTHIVTPLENPLQLRYLKRDIARILTAISERELESQLK
tara:strand:+ start:2298 stop:2501 length:204 start_codon:yes stop_codon:yes gene_type:complete